MGSKILLADDSVTIQKVVGIIFANESYDITTVANGDAAISKALEIKPDVMLIDALMPGKNGYEVCREVRQNPALSHIGILLMTGAFEAVDEEKNRQSGADEFITKPFESQSLIDATSRLIALTAQRGAAASRPAAAEPAPPPVPPVPEQSVDDVWASGFDIEPQAPQPGPGAADIPAAAVPDVTPVKVAADDDIWGAFDLGVPETAPQPLQAKPAAAPPAEEFFAFEAPAPVAVEPPADDLFVLDDVADEPVAAVPPVTVAAAPTPAADAMSFADVSFDTPVAVQPPVTVPAEDDFSTISFDEPAPVQPPVVRTAPEPPQPPAAPPVPPAAVSEPVQAAAAAIATFDESQVKELLASLSRDVIERIVWEVVPDLAETIIKEEIRKLKAGIA